ncbi:MAG: UDP-N-acetylmuramoylalanine--D-glutamate ligase [Polaromonas sp.]|nr:UDP-N-acetylmuramoylalanine--D-glutamate ligase [Polaromonas sp.]
MNNLAGKHVLVLGLGASGLAMARWCSRYGARVTVADTRPAPPQLSALVQALPDAQFVHGEMNEALFQSAPFDMVLKSPGLSPASVAPVIGAARAQGTFCGNELSLFALALAELKATRAYAPRVVAITGTNGKTTVTSLTAQLAERAGKSVAMAGNIGPTLLDTLTEKLDQEPVPAEVAPASGDTATPTAPATELPESVRAPMEVLPENDAMAPAQPPAQVFHENNEEDVLEGKGAAIAELADDTSELPVVPAIAPAPVFVALPDVWVLELSSFQLEGVSNFEPSVATVLNITQDHLDWHETMQAYAATKNRIYGAGLMLLNRDDARVMEAVPPRPALVRGKQPVGRAYLTFGGDTPQRPGDYGIETVNGMAWLVRAAEADETVKRRKDEEVVLYIQRLMPVDALRIRGRHNATNALAALALASAAGCALAPMLHGLREYRGEPHRMESLAVIRDVEYFDDSKGTNVGATVAALTGLGAERKLVVILGGEGKGQDFSPLAEPVARHARAVVLIGRDAPLIRAALEGGSVPLQEAASMQEAVELASQQARIGDAVLMSPACASFDMFDNYEHRAKAFAAAVEALAQDAGVLV